LNIIYTQI